MNTKDRAAQYVDGMSKALGVTPKSWSMKPNGDITIIEHDGDVTVIPHSEWDEESYLATST